MNARKQTIDEIIDENRRLALDKKIADNNCAERKISDEKYAPIEVKAWFIWLVALIVGTAITVVLTSKGLK